MIYDSLATLAKVFHHLTNYPALSEDGDTMWIFSSLIYPMDQNVVLSVLQSIYLSLFVMAILMACLHLIQNITFQCNHTMIRQHIVNKAEDEKGAKHWSVFICDINKSNWSRWCKWYCIWDLSENIDVLLYNDSQKRKLLPSIYKSEVKGQAQLKIIISAARTHLESCLETLQQGRSLNLHLLCVALFSNRQAPLDLHHLIHTISSLC